jgi:transcriptional regulator with XRE-family HTH domain
MRDPDSPAGYSRVVGEQAAVIGANIRALRRRRGWTQSRLGDLMGWPTPSTVSAAEGTRSRPQRGFTPDEIQRLARIFDIRTYQLTTRCATCAGHPPPGYACLTCEAGR